MASVSAHPAVHNTGPRRPLQQGGSRDVDDLVSALKVLLLKEEIETVGSFVFPSAVSRVTAWPCSEVLGWTKGARWLVAPGALHLAGRGVPGGIWPQGRGREPHLS